MKLNNLTLLTNIKLSPDYEFTIDFNNIESQNNYFDSKKANVIYDDDSYSFFRYNESIKIDCNVEELNEVNYLYYTNNSGKRYYCFVTSKEYIDDNVTIINIKCDILQTYMFNYRLGECFIERQHEDRVIIKEGVKKYHFNFNTEPENLEIGESYDIHKQATINNDNIVWVEIVATQPISNQISDSSKPNEWCNMSYEAKINNIPIGKYLYLLPIDLSGERLFIKLGDDTIGMIPRNLNDINNSEAIISMRMLSYSPVNYEIRTITNKYGNQVKSIFIDTPSYMSDVHISKFNNEKFGGIDLRNYNAYCFNLVNYNENNRLKFKSNLLPRKVFNKNLFSHDRRFKQTLTAGYVINYDSFFESKLFTYPYNYLCLTDYKSTPLDIKNEYLNEEFYGEDVKLIQSLGVVYKSKIYVTNYHESILSDIDDIGDIGDKGKEYNSCDTGNNELPLNTKAYVQYLSQNKANATIGLGLNVAQTALTAGLGFATGGFGLAVAGVEALNIAGEIGNHLIQVRDIKNTPDSLRQSGNNVIFDIQDDNILFKVYEKELNIDYRNKIGRYFYFYGYASNKIEIPNVRSRWYFNYIKCANCNIISNIDNDIIEELKSIYNNGVTIKHIRNLESDSRIDDETFSHYQNTEFDIDNEINGGIL